MYLPNMKSVTLPVYEIIAIEVWGGGETQSWEREAVDSRDGTVRKRVHDFL